jgi:hypothetical protein
MSTRLRGVADHGQSVWIDSLSRELVRGGEFDVTPPRLSGATSKTLRARKSGAEVGAEAPLIDPERRSSGFPLGHHAYPPPLPRRCGELCA